MKKNAALTTSIPYWLLLVLSLASAGVGAWLTTDQITVMTDTLLDGTATGVEVYAGQSWVVVGGALLAGGVIGLFLALALAAAKAIVPKPAVEVVEAIDWTAEREAGADAENATDAAEDAVEEPGEASETADAPETEKAKAEQAEEVPAVR